MSRSFKREPIIGHANHSEKDDKKRWHRAFRKKNRDTINRTKFDVDELDNTIFPIEKDVSNPWSMSKDGKRYWDPRRIPVHLTEIFKKIMRK